MPEGEASPSSAIVSTGFAGRAGRFLWENPQDFSEENISRNLRAKWAFILHEAIGNVDGLRRRALRRDNVWRNGT